MYFRSSTRRRFPLQFDLIVINGGAEEVAIGSRAWFKNGVRLGQAVWLLTFYWSLQGSDECSWAWVYSGAPIRDEDAASRFRISVYTAARWREKLRKAGLIRVLSAGSPTGEVIPQQSRIETVADDSDLEDVYNTERHLLYVACTRARDRLLVSAVTPASEFLDDFSK